jgi:hypothetical protein
MMKIRSEQQQQRPLRPSRLSLFRGVGRSRSEETPPERPTMHRSASLQSLVHMHQKVSTRFGERVQRRECYLAKRNRNIDRGTVVRLAKTRTLMESFKPEIMVQMVKMQEEEQDELFGIHIPMYRQATTDEDDVMRQAEKELKRKRKDAKAAKRFKANSPDPDVQTDDESSVTKEEEEKSALGANKGKGTVVVKEKSPTVKVEQHHLYFL